MPIPEKKKREDEIDKFDGYFIKHIGASVGKMAISLMLSNAINILAVRMQNVDYPNNRSFRGAVKDLFVIDKHRMFYKGLVPITIACTNLYCVTDVMHMFRNPNPLSWCGISNYVWPFIYLGGTMLVHPFMLIGMRVQCGHFAKTEKLRFMYANMFSCAHHIRSSQGIRGFYTGFVPAFFIYSLMSYEAL